MAGACWPLEAPLPDRREPVSLSNDPPPRSWSSSIVSPPPRNLNDDYFDDDYFDDDAYFDDDIHAGNHVHLVPLHVHTTHPSGSGHLPKLLLSNFIQKPFFLPLLSPASLCSPELWICK